MMGTEFSNPNAFTISSDPPKTPKPKLKQKKKQGIRSKTQPKRKNEKNKI
ncbi:hypothetical protein [Helicobacter pylori]|nr:hypothetical protein [Helicobacter pylori]